MENRGLIGEYERFEVRYTDLDPDEIALRDDRTNSGDSALYITMPGLAPRQIPEVLFCELMDMVFDERYYSHDLRTIRSCMEYDSFFDKYYNSL